MGACCSKCVCPPGKDTDAQPIAMPNPLHSATPQGEQKDEERGSAEETQGSQPEPTDTLSPQDRIIRAELITEVKRKKVQLIKPEYFLYLSENNMIMPKCQEVPPEYILNPDAPDFDWDKFVVIAISYCWISPDHPDPKGFHLETMCRLFRLFVRGSYESAEGAYFGDEMFYKEKDLLANEG